MEIDLTSIMIGIALLASYIAVFVIGRMTVPEKKKKE